MKLVNLPNFGMLPDFGNFPKSTDKYEAVEKMMAHAKGVSFKCFDFGPDGRETTMDMDRPMQIVSKSGYAIGARPGWVGIEYEGGRMTEFMGSRPRNASRSLFLVTKISDIVLPLRENKGKVIFWREHTVPVDILELGFNARRPPEKL